MSSLVMNIPREVFYERNLPHYQPSGATFHVVFRLAGSLPVVALRQMMTRHQRNRRVLGGIVQPRRRLELSAEHHTECFAQFDAALDAAVTGPRWLAEPEIARLVVEAAHHRDGKQYDLLAFCVMPNHVHMVLSVERNDISLYRILQSLKRYTAREANRVLGRHGPFWQHESYDHVIRDAAELDQTIWYVLYNPVKAGLSDAWEAWPWTYCKPGLIHQ